MADMYGAIAILSALGGHLVLAWMVYKDKNIPFSLVVLIGSVIVCCSLAWPIFLPGIIAWGMGKWLRRKK
jgi:hypothetical protein